MTVVSVTMVVAEGDLENWTSSRSSKLFTDAGGLVEMVSRPESSDLRGANAADIEAERRLSWQDLPTGGGKDRLALSTASRVVCVYEPLLTFEPCVLASKLWPVPVLCDGDFGSVGQVVEPSEFSVEIVVVVVACSGIPTRSLVIIGLAESIPQIGTVRLTERKCSLQTRTWSLSCS